MGNRVRYAFLYTFIKTVTYDCYFFLINEILDILAVMQRNENIEVEKDLSMNVNGYKTRGRPNTRWMDCVKDGVARKEVTTKMSSKRKKIKKQTCCADLK